MNPLLAGALAAAKDEAVVLFSGGRDSTLAAVRTILNGFRPRLLIGQSGFSIGGYLLDARLAELQTACGPIGLEVERVPVQGLVRNLSLVTLEEDISTHRVNLIPLGESLAVHAAGVARCLLLESPVLVNGFSGYQRHLPEQSPAGVEVIGALVAEFGVELRCPVLEVGDVKDVQYELMEYGLTPKSAEPVSIFADTCSQASPTAVRSYAEARLPHLRSFIRRFCSTATS
jgi:hypothetical protein